MITQKNIIKIYFTFLDGKKSHGSHKKFPSNGNNSQKILMSWKGLKIDKKIRDEYEIIKNDQKV